MAYSASRLTLYALFSGIEEDLRLQVNTSLTGQDDPINLLGTELWQKCKDRLEKDSGFTVEHPLLEQLMTYADFSDTYQTLNSHSSLLSRDFASVIKGATPKLEKLVPVRNRVMHFRPLNADDLASTLDISDELATSSPTFWRSLSSVLRKLKDEPSFVLSLSIPSNETEYQDIRFHLPTPDSDETGFVGRKQQVKDLIDVCLGTYPVITIVGEGGLGKTALALKVADEIAHLDDCPFDAIVWTSSKTSQLTSQEITKIQGAISDSLGIFNDVAHKLAGPNHDKDAIREVLNYMSEFRILLILDNLETVLDERIDDFIGNLPKGSKILITSRIGLGTYERKFLLQPMDPGDAVYLLRALSKSRGVPNLTATSNDNLKVYCQKMHMNPGYIKWFVAAVEAGRRPEEVLARPDIFLDFCMSNVYDYISEESRTVLSAMISLQGRHSLAELQYVVEMDVYRMRGAIHELLRTNMIVMINMPHGNSFDSFYEVSELARSYLVRHHPTSSKLLLQFRRRRTQLTELKDKMRSTSSNNPFSWDSIVTNSTSDLVVARYLRDALREAKSKNFEEADRLVELAKDLSPGYFEVNRVAAIVKALQGSISEANDLYEIAVELQPNSAPLRYWYAAFLARHLEDNKSAIEQLEVADRLLPGNLDIQQEMARTYLFLRDFDKSRSIVDSLLAKENLPVWVHRKIYDLHLQIFRRKADFYLSNRDFHSSLDELQKLKKEYQACPRNLVDDAMRQRMERAIQIAHYCSQEIIDPDSRAIAFNLCNWFRQVVYDVPKRNRVLRDSPLQRGTIDDIRESFAFIKTETGGKVFFHITSLVNRNWSEIKSGMRVSFYMDHPKNSRPSAKFVTVL